MSENPSAREGALAQLAAEAARFRAPSPTPAVPAPNTARPITVASTPRTVPAEVAPVAPPGYVPVAVAPERGNTRPVVPVDGRLHMRIAQATVDALDDVVRDWKGGAPVALRDLERATLVRVGIALALADVAANGDRGAVGEAVRAALDPAIRHTDQPMPPLTRWFSQSRRERPTPHEGPDHEDRSVAAASG